MDGLPGGEGGEGEGVAVRHVDGVINSGSSVCVGGVSNELSETKVWRMEDSAVESGRQRVDRQMEAAVADAPKLSMNTGHRSSGTSRTPSSCAHFADGNLSLSFPRFPPHSLVSIP